MDQIASRPTAKDYEYAVDHSVPDVLVLLVIVLCFVLDAC